MELYYRLNPRATLTAKGGCGARPTSNPEISRRHRIRTDSGRSTDRDFDSYQQNPWLRGGSSAPGIIPCRVPAKSYPQFIPARFRG